MAKGIDAMTAAVGRAGGVGARSRLAKGGEKPRRRAGTPLTGALWPCTGFEARLP